MRIWERDFVISWTWVGSLQVRSEVEFWASLSRRLFAVVSAFHLLGIGGWRLSLGGPCWGRSSSEFQKPTVFNCFLFTRGNLYIVKYKCRFCCCKVLKCFLSHPVSWNYNWLVVGLFYLIGSKVSSGLSSFCCHFSHGKGRS